MGEGCSGGGLGTGWVRRFVVGLPMDASDLPPQLKLEAAAVENEIRIAFRGLSRDGGVSWSESVELDLHKTPDEQAAARARDVEAHWEDLVDDLTWRHD